MTIQTQTSNGAQSINDLHIQFTELTKMDASKANAIAALEQLQLSIDSEWNFKKPATWLEINNTIAHRLNELTAIANQTNNDNDDNFDLDDDELLEDVDNTDNTDNSSLDIKQLNNWINELQLVNWSEFNSQCDLALDQDKQTHLSLDGCYKARAEKQFSFNDTKLKAKFNYGTGKVLISSDYENYRLLGTCDRTEFIPVLDAKMHRRLMTELNVTQAVQVYRTAVNLIESKLVRYNTCNASIEREKQRELSKLRRNAFAQYIDNANK